MKTGPPEPERPVDEAVVFVSGRAEWPQELVSSVTCGGYVALRIDDLTLAPRFLLKGDVRALVVGAGPLGAKDLLVLRECRKISPGTAIVVMTTAPTQTDIKRAFESGATAFLSWPAPPEVVRQALASGGVPSTAPPAWREVPALRERDKAGAAAVVVVNRLPVGHPQREGIDTALRDALAGLRGPWDVSVDLAHGRTWTITVVAPDGSSWMLACECPAQEMVDLIAERVRQASDRRARELKRGSAIAAKQPAKPPQPRTPVGRGSGPERV